MDSRSSDGTMSLAPSSSSTAFVQQGSVDWVALANTTFSAPIAILGRLSRAGLEPLTVAVAQWLFSHVPIGVHGEKLLEKTISGLSTSNILGTTIWFGFGVRHILRELPKSSQGASSVALTAALAEGFSTDFTATVLYDLVRIMDVPVDLTPSYAQWQAYVRICEGLLASSGLGERINALARVFGVGILQVNGFNSDILTDGLETAAPEQVAKFLLGIGEIQRGKVEAINAAGGVTCIWGYVICDMIFGLRTQLCGNLHTGSTTTFGTAAQNYCPSSENYQVSLVVTHSGSPSAAIVPTAKMYALHSGKSPSHFLKFPGSAALHMDATWRIPFDELLQSMLCDELHMDMHKDRTHFAVMLGCHVLVRYHSPWSRNYGQHSSPVDLLYRFASCVPDLRPFCMGAETFIVEKLNASRSDEGWQTFAETARAGRAPFSDEKMEHEFTVQMFLQDYMKARANIPLLSLNQTAGLQNRGRHGSRHANVTETWYLLVELASLCCNFSVEDGLHPSLAGIRRVLEQITLSTDKPFSFQDDEKFIGSYIITCLELFSRASSRIASQETPSAVSENGIYCYAQYLNDPLQSHAEAVRVHVGRGSITMHEGLRLCDQITDQEDESKLGPFAHKYLREYPSHPQARVLVEEGVDGLRVWFEQWQDGQFNERQAVNPGQSLRHGWFGSVGSWRGPPNGMGVYDSRKNPESLDENERVQWDRAFS